MSAYETIAMPFVKIGNRRGFTMKQVETDRNVADFVEMFKDSFEYNIIDEVMIFIEPAKEQKNENRN